jgi:polysaccharide biosynthesis/export protein
MNKSFIWRFCLFAPILYSSLLLFSCSSTKNIKYFTDIPDSGLLKTIPAAIYTEPTIQVDDILTILVETVDPQATASINLGNIPSATTSTTSVSSMLSQQTPSGFLVNGDGFVEIPILGKIKLIGYTTSQARDIVLKEAQKYYKDPTVIVRYANFKISVTGEVLKPGQYTVQNEKVTVLDALSMAGDLTIFGKRENILLIRENIDGTKTPYRIDLRKSDIMTRPYYYLKQNDVIYVEPGKGKAAVNDASQTRTFAIITSLLTIAIVIVSRINF